MQCRLGRHCMGHTHFDDRAPGQLRRFLAVEMRLFPSESTGGLWRYTLSNSNIGASLVSEPGKEENKLLCHNPPS
jgi:hypothetical protein